VDILWTLGLTLLVADAGTPATELPPPEFYRQALSVPVPTATAEDTARWLERKEVVLLDLRSPAAFARGHLKGAINLPLTDLTEQTLHKLVPNSDQRIVLYCDDQLVPTRRVALTTLGAPTARALGYAHVFRLEDLWLRQDAGVLPLVR